MPVITALVSAFIFSFVAILALQPLCERLGHVDEPGGHKRHRLATPLSGGLAIGACVVLLGCGWAPSWHFAGLSFGVMILLVLGALDDRKHVPSGVRLAFQAIAVGVGMIAIGGVRLDTLGELLGGADILLGYWSVPFTLFAAVGVINAVNMIDGMDGLAGGFAVLVLGVVWALASASTTVNLILLCLALGSVIAFLTFNMRSPWRREARSYLGDAGSLVLGYLLVWFAISASQGHNAVIDPITAVWLFGLPLVDTVYLMMVRIQHGQNPFAADRYHFHHLLQRSGLTAGAAVLVWLLVAAGFMVVGVLGQFLNVSELVRSLLFLAAFGVYCVVAGRIWRWLSSRDHDDGRKPRQVVDR